MRNCYFPHHAILQTGEVVPTAEGEEDVVKRCLLLLLLLCLQLQAFQITVTFPSLGWDVKDTPCKNRRGPGTIALNEGECQNQTNFTS